MLTNFRHLLRHHAPEIAGGTLLLILATVGWLGYQYQKQIYWVQHTLQVENDIAALWSSVQDAEIGQKAFLLTGDEAFLEPYKTGTSALATRFERLNQSTLDNPEQQQKLQELRPLVDERLFLLRRRIEDRLNGTNTVQHFRRGKEVLDLIRSKLTSMATVENELMVERSAASKALMTAAALGATLAAFLSFAIIVVWVRNSRRTSDELRIANQMLLQAISDREIGDAKIRQLQKMEAIGQLTGGIAHDFNNMLAVVIGALGLAQKRIAKGDTNIQTLIDGAMDGASRAATLTKRLLAFSRQQPLAPQTVAANAVVSGMADLIARTVGETIKTETVLAGGLWTVHVDAPLLENAILNLSVNARDAMPDGGHLTIETSNAHLDDAYARDFDDVKAGQYVMVAVSDTGTGMAQDVVNKAFDPFFTTKAVGKGTGLGLSQVHGFVKQSGGHIKIYSEVGSGTTIKMYFPRFIPAEGDGVSRSQGRPAQRIPTGDPSKLILVVEDDARVREVSVSMLRELGYMTIHADGATAALRQLDAHSNVVLMFTDIVMPDVNGRKLAEQALKRWPDLKVLFTTGFTRNAVVHNGVLDADVQLLQKPFTIEELAQKIRAVLEAETSSEPISS